MNNGNHQILNTMEINNIKFFKKRRNEKLNTLLII